MTFFSHVDPDFESVFAIEAINEPLMNATLTPGLGQCGHLSTRGVVPILITFNSSEGLCPNHPCG